MRETKLLSPDALRLESAPQSRAHGAGHTSGFRPAVSSDGRSALRPGGARLDGDLQPAGFDKPDSRALSGRGQRASGSGRADGRNLGTFGGGVPAGGPRFDGAVPDNGYIWWYLDGLSDDGRHGITIIAFIGSVFSSYYAWQRNKGDADPYRHCALNVALYGRAAKRWAFTERDRSALTQEQKRLGIGPSRVTWTGEALEIDIREVSVPVPRPVRGKVRLIPDGLTDSKIELDPEGRQRWWPIAPCARIEVALERPSLSWSGIGYLDSNEGERPLEDSFSFWNWSRASLSGGRTAILYEATHRNGVTEPLGFLCRPGGSVERFEPPAPQQLSRTFWRMQRPTRVDAGGSARVVETLEDAPFYSRSVIETELLGERAHGVHESLCLDRFSQNWVRMLIPWRNPRALR